MKFQVAKSDLEFALSTVSGALSAGDADISSHFVFRIKPGTTDQLEVLTASNRSYAQCTVPKALVTDIGMPFTIEGSRLRGWISVIGDVALDVETLADQEVQVKAGKYTQRFRSLDPAKFQYMDKTVATAELKSTIKAKRLVAAFKAAKAFASTDDSNKPDVVVLDIKDGLLMATDKSSVVVFFTLKDLTDCTFRVHVKDVSNMSGFLESIDDTVEVLDAKRLVFLRRVSDGAIYGETRYQIEFPTLNPSNEVDQRIWTVKSDDLRRAARNGFFGATKYDNRLFLGAVNAEGCIPVSMKTDTNSKVATTVPVACQEVINDPTAPDVPTDGFPVSYQHIMALLDAFPGDETISLGVNVHPAKKKRYIRVTKKVFEDPADDSCDTYVFVMAGMVW